MKQLFITSLIILTSIITLAQNDSIIKFKEVEISSKRNNQLVSESLRIVKTISKDEILAMPAQNINEILDYIPGIDVRQRGINGTQADISMRGGSFDQILILINGINITDPQTGHHNLNLPIDLEMIDRIEILQGTSMNLFGLSAFSGAINIITGTSTKNEIKASVSGGGYNYINPKLGFNYKTDKWTFSGSASHSQSKGYIKNTDYKYNNAFFNTKYSDKNIGVINFNIGAQIKEFGANSFYTLKFPDQFEATKALISSLQWEKHFGNFNLSASTYYRRHHDRFELFRGFENAASWYKNHNYHQTDISGANIKTSIFSSIGKSSFGIELRNEHIFSNVLGDKLEKEIPVKFEKGSNMFNHAKNRLNINYFAEHSYFSESFSASIGASGNHNSMFGNNFCFGGNLSYKIISDLSLYANINRSLRLPTFTDLYYKSVVQQSNPNLKPEEAINYELGAKYKYKDLRVNLITYFRDGKNIIDWVRLPNEAVWKSLNHGKIKTLGSELIVGYSINDWIKNIELGASYTNLKINSGELMSKYALDHLKYKLTASVNHKIYKGFGASWQLTYQEREGSYLNISDETVKYTPFCLLDGSIYWSNKHLKVFTEVTNIFNTKYYDFGGLKQVGIWVKAGVSVNIGI